MSLRDEYLGAGQGDASKRLERLLPHSELSERGVLGSILCPFEALTTERMLATVREQFAGESAFYLVQHQTIFNAMCALMDRGRGLDVITLLDELRDTNQLDVSARTDYVCDLPNHGTATMLQHYLEGVWEKHLARQLIQNSSLVTDAALKINGINETLIGRMVGLHEEFIRKTQRGAITPQHLKPALEFSEAAMSHFFGAAKMDAPGHDLPFPFPLKIRSREATLLFGDDGSGKSTVLSYVVLHLLQHPEQKAVMASFEVPPEITLWICAAQLLGRKAFWENDESRKTIAGALAWLNTRLILYDFQGIANWREVRDAFRYASEKQGATLFTIDNAMRMGIADDDYAQQALAAATLHQFAEDHAAHVFIVLHENKGEGKGKAKIRGSKLWSANMNNVLGVKINSDKAVKIDKLNYNLTLAKSDPQPSDTEIAEIESDIRKAEFDWDTEILLHKQRYPGTRQNGSKRIWFDRNCFQFRHEYNAGAVNWLERWRGK